MSRNGGLLQDGEDLIRVAQNLQFGSYGASARLFRITRLTLDDYTEEFVGRLTPVFMPGIHGTHHCPVRRFRRDDAMKKDCAPARSQLPSSLDRDRFDSCLRW